MISNDDTSVLSSFDAEDTTWFRLFLVMVGAVVTVVLMRMFRALSKKSNNHAYARISVYDHSPVYLFICWIIPLCLARVLCTRAHHFLGCWRCRHLLSGTRAWGRHHGLAHSVVTWILCATARNCDAGIGDT